MAEAVVRREGVPGAPAEAARPPKPKRTFSQWVEAVTATNAVVLVLNLCTGILAARILGPAGKGVFNAINVWTGVFSSLAGMGLSTAFVSLYARSDEARRPGLARAALSLAVFWGVLAGLCVYFLAPRLVGHLAPAAAAWSRASSPLVALITISGAAGGILSAQTRFGSLNWISFGRAVLYAAAIVIFAGVGILTPYSQLTVSWSLFYIGCLITLVVALTGLPLRLGPVRWADLWGLSTLGWRFYSFSLLGLFNSQLDQMLASAWLTARDVGLYAVAISSLSIVGMLPGSVGMVMFPMMAGDSRDAIIARTTRVLRVLSPLLVLTMVVTCVGAWPFLDLLYGNAYLPAIPVVWIIAPTAVFVGAISILYQGCYALRWFAGPTWGEGVGAVGGALLLWLLIPRWGLDGAAAATMLSYLADLLVVLVFWSRASGTPARDLLCRREDLHYLVRELRRRLRLSHLLKGAWS